MEVFGTAPGKADAAQRLQSSHACSDRCAKEKDALWTEISEQAESPFVSGLVYFLLTLPASLSGTLLQTLPDFVSH